MRHAATGHVEVKGLLVQAKKRWTGTNRRLFEQVGNMEELAPGGSAAIEYAADGYTGIDGRAVLDADGDRPEAVVFLVGDRMRIEIEEPRGA